MLIKAGYDITFTTQIPTAVVAQLSIRPERARDLVSPHRIEMTPDVPIYDYVDAFGNTCTRFTIPPGGLTLSCDFTIEDGANKTRFSLYSDITNVLNAHNATALQYRVPQRTIGLETVQFGSPTAIIAPRQATLGARWSF